MVLNCGPYDPERLTTAKSGVVGFLVRKVVDSYFATDDLQQASVSDHATADFPRTWFSGGNDDPLTPQGKSFAKRLGEFGVDVQTLFFPADHTPKLAHEYQFDLDSAAGKRAVDETLAFLESL